MSAAVPVAALVPFAAAVTIPHNTLVVAGGVAAVGFAAGVAGCFAVLRRRALAGDAAAHATLVGVAAAFLATGRRDLPTLLAGAMVAAAAALGALVLILIQPASPIYAGIVQGILSLRNLRYTKKCLRSTV